MKNIHWKERCNEANTLTGNWANSLGTSNKEENKMDLIKLSEWKKRYEELLIEKRPLFMKVNYNYITI